MENYHICLCSDNSYLKYAAVLIYSIIKASSKNNSQDKGKFIFHILGDGFTEDNLNLIKEFNKKINEIYPSDIRTYDVSEKQFSGNSSWGEGGGYTTYLRLLIPDVLDKSIKRILYLDCDMLCSNDIRPIFRVDLFDRVAGAVPDPWIGQHRKIICHSKKLFRKSKKLIFSKEECYFNAGLLLIDADAWRSHSITKHCLEVLKNYKLHMNDQDALNIVLKNKIKLIPFAWNFIGTTVGTIYLRGYSNCLQIKDDKVSSLITPYLTGELSKIKILHYAGRPKPWQGKFAFADNGKLLSIDKPFYTFYLHMAEECPVFNNYFNLLNEDYVNPNYDEHIEKAVNALGRWVQYLEYRHSKRWNKTKFAFYCLFFLTLLTNSVILLGNLIR